MGLYVALIVWMGVRLNVRTMGTNHLARTSRESRSLAHKLNGMADRIDQELADRGELTDNRGV